MTSSWSLWMTRTQYCKDNTVFGQRELLRTLLSLQYCVLIIHLYERESVGPFGSFFSYHMYDDDTVLQGQYSAKMNSHDWELGLAGSSWEVTVRLDPRVWFCFEWKKNKVCHKSHFFSEQEDSLKKTMVFLSVSSLKEKSVIRRINRRYTRHVTVQRSTVPALFFRAVDSRGKVQRSTVPALFFRAVDSRGKDVGLWLALIKTSYQPFSIHIFITMTSYINITSTSQQRHTSRITSTFHVNIFHPYFPSRLQSVAEWFHIFTTSTSYITLAHQHFINILHRQHDVVSTSFICTLIPWTSDINILHST